MRTDDNKTDRILSRRIPLSAGAPLEVERWWLQGLRERGPVWRLAQAVSLSSHGWRAAQDAFQRGEKSSFLNNSAASAEFRQRLSSLSSDFLADLIGDQNGGEII